jgi:hypothetical protein
MITKRNLWSLLLTYEVTKELEAAPSLPRGYKTKYLYTYPIPYELFKENVPTEEDIDFIPAPLAGEESKLVNIVVLQSPFRGGGG